MQSLYFYFDDSGVLHTTSQVKTFIYAGYVFTSRQGVDRAKRRYKKSVKNIQLTLGRTDEIKAYGLRTKYKRALYNVMRTENSIVAVVDINRVYPYILASKKSICRYKDYILKIVIKEKIKDLIDDNVISPDEDITIHVSVDEQLTATDGIYGLQETIKEELQYGISNYNYGRFYPKLFNKNVDVIVKYCESKSDYMIQACDILANRIYTSYRDNKPELRKIPNHKVLLFP